MEREVSDIRTVQIMIKKTLFDYDDRDREVLYDHVYFGDLNVHLN